MIFHKVVYSDAFETRLICGRGRTPVIILLQIILELSVKVFFEIGRFAMKLLTKKTYWLTFWIILYTYQLASTYLILWV